MSGTPRPVAPVGRVGTLAVACQVGRGNAALTPPPVALFGPSFQTTSSPMPPPAASVTRVPPHASTNGLDAGKSTWPLRSPTPSSEPLSPAAAQTVTPIAAADWNAWSYVSMPCCVQVDSGTPQLIEMTDGRRTLSWIARVIALRNPSSVLGAK